MSVDGKACIVFSYAAKECTLSANCKNALHWRLTWRGCDVILTRGLVIECVEILTAMWWSAWNNLTNQQVEITAAASVLDHSSRV